jgi:hypothetical protein
MSASIDEGLNELNWKDGFQTKIKGTKVGAVVPTNQTQID